MKKIINGKMYNTETAKCLARYDNNLPVDDFCHCAEDLYIKKTGEYFLHGYGGARSEYGMRRGDYICWGDTIIPMTESEAKQWAEEHIDADHYGIIFGTPEE